MCHACSFRCRLLKGIVPWIPPKELEVVGKNDWKRHSYEIDLVLDRYIRLVTARHFGTCPYFGDNQRGIRRCGKEFDYIKYILDSQESWHSVFSQKDQIFVLLVLAVLFFFTKSLFGIFLSKLILQEVGDLQVSITRRLLQRMFTSPMVRVLNEKREEILHGLTDGLNSICVGIIGTSILVLGEIITLLGIIGFLFVVNFAMATGVILYFVFLSFMVTRITGR